MAVNGQLWYLTQGGADSSAPHNDDYSDARLSYINSDGTGATNLVQNTGVLPEPLATGFPAEVVVDTAAGLYYVLANSGNLGDNAKLLMGHIGSAAAPTVVFTFAADDVVNAIHIDPFNQRVYVGYTNVDLNTNLEGIVRFDYVPSSGAIAPFNGTLNNSFIVSQTTANVQSSTASAVDLMAVRDFDINYATNTLYFAQLTLGDGFESNLVWRIDLNNPTAAAVPLIPQTQFPLDYQGSVPDPDTGEPDSFGATNGFIYNVEVDSSRSLVYFTTQDRRPGGPSNPDNAIWVTSATNNGTVNATQVTLSGGGFNQTTFYPGDMVLDEVNHIIYVESEQGELGNNPDDDVILAFQLNGAGTAGTLIGTFTPTPGFHSVANIGGMTFELAGTTRRLVRHLEPRCREDQSDAVVDRSDHHGHRWQSSGERRRYRQRQLCRQR